MTDRIVIHSVELTNFKSFAGTVTIGPLHPSFTAVVGPNGSGKSNILESLLFAFGKRSSALRFNSLDHLVHHSQGYKEFQTASVSVFFKRLSQSEEEPPLLRITRTITKKHPAVYKLNGQVCTAEAVINTLRDEYNLDLKHNRFLIQQGEVEKISLMTPKKTNKVKGLLEYIENIIGSNQYKTPIKNERKKVLEANERKCAVFRQYKASEIRLGTLTHSRNSAFTYLASWSTVYKLKRLQYSIEVYIYKQSLHHTNGRIDQTTKEQTQLENRLAELRAELATLDKDKSQLDTEFTGIFPELRKNQQTLRKAQLELQRLNQELENSGTIPKALKKRFDSLNKQSNELKTELTRLNTQELPKLTREQKRAKEEERSLLNRVTRLRQPDESLEQGYESLESIRREHRLQLNAIAQEENKLVRLNYETASFEQKLCEVPQEIARLHRDLQEALHNSEQSQNSIQENEEKLKASSQNRSNATLLDQRVNSLKKERDRLTQINQQCLIKNQRRQGQSNFIKELMEEVAHKRISGVLGVLGDLGEVPARYNIAASTAGQGVLQSIVVETRESAEAVLKFAQTMDRQVRCLDLQRITEEYHPTYDQPSRDVDAQRIIDLVVTDTRFRPLFFMAFHNTLVAQNSETAMRLAFNSGARKRVVTLAGMLIDPAGPMQGSSAPPKDLIRTTSAARPSHADHRKIQNDLKQAEAKYKQAKIELREALEQQNAERVMQATLIEKQHKHQLLTQTVEDIRNQLQAQETQDLSSFQTQLRDKQSEVAQTEESLRALRDKAEALHVQAEQCEGELRARQSREFAQANNELATVRDEIHRISESITKTQTEINTRSAELTDIQGKIHNLEQDIISSDHMLAEQRDKRAKLTQECKTLVAEIDVLATKQKKIEQSIKERQKTHESLVTEHLTLKESMFALDSSLSKLEKKKSSAQHGLATSKDAVEASYEHHQELWKDYSQLYTAAVNQDTRVEIKNKEGLPSPPDCPYLYNIDEEFSSELLEQWSSEKDVIKRVVADQLHKAETLPKPTDLSRCFSQYFDGVHEMLIQFDNYMEAVDKAKQRTDKLTQLEITRRDQFEAGFTEISAKLKEVYRELTKGGDAELEFADFNDPFSAGLRFTVRPPKKTWKQIRNLSGGEKTLSSLALIFALHAYKPNPIYVLDEIDAALDYDNVSLVAKFIQSNARNAQFIVVSLRSNMFEKAECVTGVYKTEDTTKVMLIEPWQIIDAMPDCSISEVTRQKLKN